MKVLIVGKDSYIGNHIEDWLLKKNWSTCQLDTLTDEWKQFDYSLFDAIVYVAGIVHRPDCRDWMLYKTVNADMPHEIAIKAKEQGVRSFVYFSSMAVYGQEKRLVPTVIDENSPLLPVTMYGSSKLIAEQELVSLNEKCFNVSFVRPPSVYGKGCKGNYISGFISVVKKLPVIPKAFQNVKQSMIYIDNLCELVFIILNQHLNGVFCPQDEKSVCANEILNAIGKGLGMSVKSSSLLGALLRFIVFIPLVKKAYGGIEYSESLSNANGIPYRVVSFAEGMRRTVSN